MKGVYHPTAKTNHFRNGHMTLENTFQDRGIRNAEDTQIIFLSTFSIKMVNRPVLFNGLSRSIMRLYVGHQNFCRCVVSISNGDCPLYLMYKIRTIHGLLFVVLASRERVSVYQLWMHPFLTIYNQFPETLLKISMQRVTCFYKKRTYYVKQQ